MNKDGILMHIARVKAKRKVWQDIRDWFKKTESKVLVGFIASLIVFMIGGGFWFSKPEGLVIGLFFWAFCLVMLALGFLCLFIITRPYFAYREAVDKQAEAEYHKLNTEGELK